MTSQRNRDLHMLEYYWHMSHTEPTIYVVQAWKLGRMIADNWRQQQSKAGK